MNFLALLLGLGVERMLTHLFHLREFRWLNPFFDWAFGKLARTSRWVAAGGIIVVTCVAIFPVSVVALLLQGTLADIPYFVFAVIVLLFCLGPHDLLDEGNDFCEAINKGDLVKARDLAKDIVEDCEFDSDGGLSKVDAAVYVQANNRIFSVVFWFVVLGPLGAWLFRTVDLMRHRATSELPRLSHEATQRITIGSIDGATLAIFYLHGVLAWLPSRLLILGYMLAGSFDGAIVGARAYFAQSAHLVSHLSTDILSWVGRGAVGQELLIDAIESEGLDSELTGSAEEIPLFAIVAAERALSAVNLVRRTLWLIWCPTLAILTLTDWLF